MVCEESFLFAKRVTKLQIVLMKIDIDSGVCGKN